MYGIDILEEAGPLTEHDYEFLKGNDKYWAHTGAALNLCMSGARIMALVLSVILLQRARGS